KLVCAPETGQQAGEFSQSSIRHRSRPVVRVPSRALPRVTPCRERLREVPRPLVDDAKTQEKGRPPRRGWIGCEEAFERRGVVTVGALQERHEGRREGAVFISRWPSPDRHEGFLENACPRDFVLARLRRESGLRRRRFHPRDCPIHAWPEYGR